jgi:hypothetical protein
VSQRVTRETAAERINVNGRNRRQWAMRTFFGVLQAAHPEAHWQDLQVAAAQAADRVGDIIALRNPDGELADEYPVGEFDSLLTRLNRDHATEVLLHAIVLLDRDQPPTKPETADAPRPPT